MNILKQIPCSNEFATIAGTTII